MFSLNMCGDGIVEDGEECDPGLGVILTCCNSSTCKLRPGAMCDPPSDACCTRICQYARATQICRPSKDSSCDIGLSMHRESATCPRG